MAEPGGLGGGGAVAPPVFAKCLQNLPFLPQILAFLCLQPPHIPVSRRTFKFTPPSMLSLTFGKVKHKKIGFSPLSRDDELN